VRCQRRLDLLAGIDHRFQALSATQVGMHHAPLDRAGAHDRHFDDQIVEAARAQPRQHAHLGTRLDLEHPHRIAGRDHVVGGRVFRGDVLDPEGAGDAVGTDTHAMAGASLGDELQRAPDGAQHAQRQHVHLEQAQGIEVVLVPLDDGAVGHGRVLHRHQAREPIACDHEAAGVLRQVARKAHQRVGHLDPVLHL
jgi:hypothetical protein